MHDVWALGLAELIQQLVEAATNASALPSLCLPEVLYLHAPIPLQTASQSDLQLILMQIVWCAGIGQAPPSLHMASQSDLQLVMMRFVWCAGFGQAPHSLHTLSQSDLQRILMQVVWCTGFGQADRAAGRSSSTSSRGVRPRPARHPCRGQASGGP